MFYAESNFYGTNVTYDSNGWSFYSFDTAASRDRWLKHKAYRDGNLVAQACSAKTAKRYGKDDITHIVETEECELCGEDVSIYDAVYPLGMPRHPKCNDDNSARIEAAWMKSHGYA